MSRLFMQNEASCLYIAAQNGHTEVCKVLAEAGGRELLMKAEEVCVCVFVFVVDGSQLLCVCVCV